MYDQNGQHLLHAASRAETGPFGDKLVFRPLKIHHVQVKILGKRKSRVKILPTLNLSYDITESAFTIRVKTLWGSSPRTTGSFEPECGKL
jgi:hypothetical protein